jgi:Dolichyl-phosphate-mannose-protein mannosyltransferase
MTAAVPGGPWRAAAALALVLAVAGALSLRGLGDASLLGDEAIYAGPARRAAVDGDWYPLRNGEGELFTSKPPLAMWIEALSFRTLGVSELAARLPNALAGMALAALVLGVGAWLWGLPAGILAALLLAATSSWLLRNGVRCGAIDPLLTLALSAALLLYLRYRTTGRLIWLGAAGAAAAAAALLKSVVGPVELLAVTASFELALAVAGRRAGALAEPGPPGAPSWKAPLALAGGGAVVLLAWFADVTRRSPDFPARLWADTVVRGVRGVDPGHVQGIGFYGRLLADDFGLLLAAGLLAPLALAGPWRQGGARARAALLLPLWTLVILGLLSLSVSKLPWYPDAALPPLVLLLAGGLCAAIARLAQPPLPAAIRPLPARMAPALGRAPALLLALAVTWLTGRHLLGAWRAVSAPPLRTEMHRFAGVYRQLPRARLYLDLLRPRRPEQLREWNYFYLFSLPARQAGLPAPPDGPGSPDAPNAASRCAVLVTMRPESLARRPDLAAAPTLHLAKFDARESDLAIVDLCGGAVLRGMALAEAREAREAR